MTWLSMAVEASRRDIIYQGEASRFDDQIQTAACGNKTEMTDLFPANVFKAESGVTLTSSFPISRKRLRDPSCFNPPYSLPIAHPDRQQFGAFEFLTDDMASQMYQQQLEIDRFIAHHTEKVRIQIEEIRRRNWMRLKATYELMINRLKTKEDEILKIGQLNRSLEEKVKSITIENQIWRELAQTNEATTNALRNNLQQVLAEIQLQQQQKQQCLDFGDNCDDAQSHNGSNFDEDLMENERRLRNVNDESEYCKSRTSCSGRLSRRCRKCRKEEACVLLLPCRHLCVCSLCVSSVNICPICNSIKSAGVHVNMT